MVVGWRRPRKKSGSGPTTAGKRLGYDHTLLIEVQVAVLGRRLNEISLPKGGGGAVRHQRMNSSAHDGCLLHTGFSIGTRLWRTDRASGDDYINMGQCGRYRRQLGYCDRYLARRLGCKLWLPTFTSFNPFSAMSTVRVKQPSGGPHSSHSNSARPRTRRLVTTLVATRMDTRCPT
jgi:hypothetical protein